MAVQFCPRVESEPTPVMRCWECDEYVPAGQRLRSVALYQAIICSDCEPLVRSLLHGAWLELAPEDTLP